MDNVNFFLSIEFCELLCCAYLIEVMASKSESIYRSSCRRCIIVRVVVHARICQDGTLYIRSFWDPWLLSFKRNTRLLRRAFTDESPFNKSWLQFETNLCSNEMFSKMSSENSGNYSNFRVSFLFPGQFPLKWEGKLFFQDIKTYFWITSLVGIYLTFSTKSAKRERLFNNLAGLKPKTSSPSSVRVPVLSKTMIETLPDTLILGGEIQLIFNLVSLEEE